MRGDRHDVIFSTFGRNSPDGLIQSDFGVGGPTDERHRLNDGGDPRLQVVMITSCSRRASPASRHQQPPNGRASFCARAGIRHALSAGNSPRRPFYRRLHTDPATGAATTPAARRKLQQDRRLITHPLAGLVRRPPAKATPTIDFAPSRTRYRPPSASNSPPLPLLGRARGKSLARPSVGTRGRATSTGFSSGLVPRRRRTRGCAIRRPTRRPAAGNPSHKQQRRPPQ